MAASFFVITDFKRSGYIRTCQIAYAKTIVVGVSFAFHSENRAIVRARSLQTGGGAGILILHQAKKRDWVTHFRTMYVHGLMAAQKGRGRGEIRKRSLRKHSLLRRRRNNNSQNTRSGGGYGCITCTEHQHRRRRRRWMSLYLQATAKRFCQTTQPDPTRGAGFPKRSRKVKANMLYSTLQSVWQNNVMKYFARWRF